MDLRQLLQLIDITAKRIGTKAYICGGAVRDKVLGKLNQIKDIDITTGDNKIHLLGLQLHRALPQADYRVMEDGHAQFIIDGLKIDLSSNFMVPGIKEILQKAGLNATAMQCELYSRDFTCNALLMSLDLKTISDPTGLGLTDIKRKMIRTCLPAQLTLGSQNKRIVRVIYMAAKLGFQVDPEIINWVKKQPQAFGNAKPKYLAEKIQKALTLDKNRTIKLLDEMNVWHYVPAMPGLTPYMNSPGRI